MKKFTTWSLVFLLFMSLIPAFNPATKASSSTWYVSPTGNDNNAGDISYPFKTLQKAINASKNSDMIYLRGGNYNTIYSKTKGIGINRSGTSQSWFTISGYPGERAVINGNGYSLASSYAVLHVGTASTFYSYVRITNLVIENITGDAITLYGEKIGSDHHIRIDNCSINKITLRGLKCWSEYAHSHPVNNITVENCTFNNTQTSYSMGEGVTFYGCKDISFHHNTLTYCPKIMLDVANNTKNMKIFKNTFITTVGTGIKTDGSQDAKVGATNENISIYNNLFYGTARAISIETEFKGGNKNISVYNNIINVYNKTTSVMAIKLGQVLPYKQLNSNIIIKYNTINVWQGSGSPLQLEIYRTSWSNIIVANNIFQSNDTASWQVRSSRANFTDPCFHFSNNIYNHATKPANTAWLGGTQKFEATAILSSPQFVDRKTGNFYLNSTSPAIDAADATYTVSTDYDDHPRPQKKSYDIGAYEYYTTLPPTITNILITPNSQQKGKYLNISCHVTDNDGGVKEVRVHITYPDHTTQNISMNPRYYLNQTYSQKGTYQFFIWADDTSGNSVKSAIYQFSITSNGAPVIIDNSMNTAGTGDKFVVTTTITNSDSVTAAYLEYWFDNKTKTNVSMSNTAGDTWEYHSIRIPIRSTDDLYYNISAKNVNNTWSSLTNQQVTVIDDDSPVISNVLATPDSITQGEYVNITCDVNDNIKVDTVKVNISGPVGFTPVHTMLNTGSYYYNTTYTIAGTYEYFIWANDTNRNSDLSMKHTFQIKSLFSSTFLVGMISDENDSNESTINFKAKLVISIEFNPFSFNILSSNEKIVVTKNSKGYIGTKFIIGMFNAAVVSENNSNGPLNHRILTRLNRESQ